MIVFSRKRSFPIMSDIFSVEYCPVRTMSGKCCFIPFIQGGQPRKGCLIDQETKKAWCSLTQNYDDDGKKEECNTTVESKLFL